MRATRLLIVLGLFFIGPLLMPAQVPPPPSTGGPGCWPPPCVPVDGGLVFLIAAGAAYGGKKILEYKKQNSRIS